MQTTDIRIWNYGNYSSDNYGSCRAVTIGPIDLYFSYDTVIAFRDSNGLVIRQNSWGPTTGKHLNAIDADKSKRISGEEFQKKLEECLARYNLSRVTA